MVQMLNGSRTGDTTVSHSIFQISPKDNSWLLAECDFTPVSRWAFECFAEVYERYDAHAANTLYRQISTSPLSASLWGYVFEVRVLLNYVDARGCNFKIRGLASDSKEPWKCRGPVPRFNFLQESNFVNELTKAIQEKKVSLHLVPSVHSC